MRRLHIYLVSVLIIFVLARFSVYADEGLRQNQASFKWIRPVQGQILKPYSEGMAAYCVAGKWGYLDKNGNIEKEWRKVKVKGHVDEIIDYLTNQK